MPEHWQKTLTDKIEAGKAHKVVCPHCYWVQTVDDVTVPNTCDQCRETIPAQEGEKWDE